MLDLLVILDRSGSMQDAKKDHEGGLKSFVEDQKNGAGEARFTLIQFDTANPCEVVYDRVPLDDVKEITLVPRGGTPLLDAMGRALDHLTKHNPEEVIAMIITDGEENESREWTKARVAARVKELEGKGWTFLFLGAGIDAFAEAGSAGIAAGQTMAFSHAPGITGQSVSAMYTATASNAGAYRALRSKGQSVNSSRQSLNFTDAQRIASSGGGAGGVDDPNTFNQSTTASTLNQQVDPSTATTTTAKDTE